MYCSIETWAISATGCTQRIVLYLWAVTSSLNLSTYPCELNFVRLRNFRLVWIRSLSSHITERDKQREEQHMQVTPWRRRTKWDGWRSRAAAKREGCSGERWNAVIPGALAVSRRHVVLHSERGEEDAEFGLPTSSTGGASFVSIASKSLIPCEQNGAFRRHWLRPV